MIYMDNAATTIHKPESVVEAVADAMRHMGNAGRGAHDAALDASRLIFETRQQAAELFGLRDPSGVAFTANATESLNIAIRGLLEPGDHVITTVMEHNSVLRPLYLMEAAGVTLTIIPADAKGMICYEAMEAAVNEKTKAIVCTHASNLTGNRIDIGRMGKLCARHGILLVVDASQSAGVLEIDMGQMGIHVLCFTGHKSLRGPQGTGGICVAENVVIRPLLVGGSGIRSYERTHPADMPAALEAGTLNGHGIAGLHAALTHLKQEGIGRIRSRELMLMRRFYDGVRAIPEIVVYGDFEEELRAPIVALNLGDLDSGWVADELAVAYGISTRAGAHCAPLMHEALGTKEQGAVRFSFSYSNTEEEVDQAVEAIREIAVNL